MIISNTIVITSITVNIIIISITLMITIITGSTVIIIVIIIITSCVRTITTIIIVVIIAISPFCLGWARSAWLRDSGQGFRSWEGRASGSAKKDTSYSSQPSSAGDENAIRRLHRPQALSTFTQWRPKCLRV